MATTLPSHVRTECDVVLMSRPRIIYVRPRSVDTALAATAARHQQQHQQHQQQQQQYQSMAPKAFASADPNLVQIDAHLFVGNELMLKNERKLCRLNISYFIRIEETSLAAANSSVNAAATTYNHQQLDKLPCQCSKQHAKFHMSIEMEATSATVDSLCRAFVEMNRFIRLARRQRPDAFIMLYAARTNMRSSPLLLCASLQCLMIERDDMSHWRSARRYLQSLLAESGSCEHASCLTQAHTMYLDELERVLTTKRARKARLSL